MYAAAILSVSSAAAIQVTSSTVGDLPSIQTLSSTDLGDAELDERACRIDFHDHQPGNKHTAPGHLVWESFNTKPGRGSYVLVPDHTG